MASLVITILRPLEAPLMMISLRSLRSHSPLNRGLRGTSKAPPPFDLNRLSVDLSGKSLAEGLSLTISTLFNLAAYL
ncbi:MAG: hypothetical protein MGAcid_07780 [uncultured Acidilobus sp. MG]|jgi:hypothetical protein|nr:MAG: hypothetical protein MGAcid_07780 [uncultured Acidilobus sp. MG]